MAKGKYEYWLTPEGLIKLEGWARDGLTDEQIASNMGIRRETLIDWKKKYPNISNTLKKGKEIIDYEVENALLKRALGYEYTETKTKVEGGAVTEVTTTTKQVVPDVTAQIFWLKNRKPSSWRDKPEPVIQEETADDGFMDAIHASAGSDWSDEEEETDVSF